MITAADEPDPWKRMEQVTLAERRRHYRETTPGERIEEPYEQNEHANEIHEGELRAQRK